MFNSGSHMDNCDPLLFRDDRHFEENPADAPSLVPVCMCSAAGSMCM